MLKSVLGRTPRTTYARLARWQSTGKTFEAARFSLPVKTLKKESSGLNNAPQNPNTEHKLNPVPAQLNPFDVTRLLRGSTDLKIGITDNAKNKLVSIAQLDQNEDLALRVKVESGGCHGFQYNFELATLKEELEKEPELVVFQRTDTPLATVAFDESSLEILQDSKIDYTNELIGSLFKMVDSPYTLTSCGCGASFDFDFEKLEQSKGRK